MIKKFSVKNNEKINHKTSYFGIFKFFWNYIDIEVGIRASIEVGIGVSIEFGIEKCYQFYYRTYKNL